MNRKSTGLMVTFLVAACSSSSATDGGAADSSVTDAPTLADANVDAAVVDAAADVSIDTPVTPDAPIADASQTCEAAGTYELESYFCDATDITTTWQSVIPQTTLVVTSTPGGDCKAKATYSAPACVESESFEFKIATATTLKFNGIDSCQPASCKFSTNDAACLVGDRQSSKPGDVTFIIGGLNRIKIETDLGDNVCPGAAKNRLTFRQK